jgi:hypothetical protein
MSRGLGLGERVALGAGSGSITGEGAALGTARGGMATPARSSAGPAGAGLGVGVASGRVKVPGCCWAKSGAVSASAAAVRQAGKKRVGKRFMAR